MYFFIFFFCKHFRYGFSAMPSNALPPYDDDNDDVIIHNERKRTSRGRRHIYNENYVSDDQNNGK